MTENRGKWMLAGGLGAAAGIGALLLFQASQGGPATDGNIEAAKSAAGFGDKETAAVEAIVRDYILKNPEIIPEAVEKLREKQLASAIEPIRADLEKPFATNAYAGNPKGTVTVVAFSDFSCPYCKTTAEDIDKLIAANPDVKVVFRDLPILSEASDDAAKMALAAADQGKYYAFYKAMFAAGRPATATIAQAARKAGLNISKAEKFAASNAAAQEIETNKALARQIPFGDQFGTPAWVVGNQVTVGALGFEALNDLVANARKAAQ